MLIVTELFNIATSDFGARKSGRCKYMVVLTELIVSGTHCRLEFLTHFARPFSLRALGRSSFPILGAANNQTKRKRWKAQYMLQYTWNTQCKHLTVCTDPHYDPWCIYWSPPCCTQYVLIFTQILSAVNTHPDGEGGGWKAQYINGLTVLTTFQRDKTDYWLQRWLNYFAGHWLGYINSDSDTIPVVGS